MEPEEISHSSNSSNSPSTPINLDPKNIEESQFNNPPPGSPLKTSKSFIKPEVEIWSLLLKPVEEDYDSNSEDKFGKDNQKEFQNIELGDKEKSRFIETLQLKLFKAETKTREMMIEELKYFLQREGQYKNKLNKLHQE